MRMIIRKNGFTLMEMLIVVAIIAILIAIAIPVFSAELEKSRANVCLANRRSLLSVCYADAMTTDADTTSIGLQKAFAREYSASDQAQKNYVCPSGGKYAWSGVNITCSKHGLETITVGNYTFSPSVNIKELPTSFPADLKKGELYQLNGQWYTIRSDQTNFSMLSSLTDNLKSYGAKLDFTQPPLTSASFDGEYSYYGAIYQADDGNLYVQTQSTHLNRKLLDVSNDAFWEYFSLIGNAA